MYPFGHIFISGNLDATASLCLALSVSNGFWKNKPKMAYFIGIITLPSMDLGFMFLSNKNILLHRH